MIKPKYHSITYKAIDDDGNQYTVDDLCGLLNEQQATISALKEENEQLKKARDESDKFIAKKGLGVEFLNWCVANE